MGTAVMASMTDMTPQAPIAENQSEAIESLLIVQAVQSGAEAPIPLSPLASTPPPSQSPPLFDRLEKEE